MNALEISGQTASKVVVKKVLAKVPSFLAAAPIFSLAGPTETKTFKHSSRYGMDSIAITGQLLGPVEQGLLLQIIASAGTSGKRLMRKNRDGSSSLMWELLYPNYSKVPTGVGVAIHVSVSPAELLRAASLSGCNTVMALDDYLCRLSEIDIKDGELSSKLLVVGYDETDYVSFALNPCIGAAACFGARYKGVRLDERQLLVTQEARLIHAWLSAVLWPGDKETFNARSLAFAIWPEQNTNPGKQYPAELEAVGLAHVLELQNCGWKVTVMDNTATVWRPGLGLPPRYGAKHPSHPDYKSKKPRSFGWMAELDLPPGTTLSREAQYWPPSQYQKRLKDV